LQPRQGLLRELDCLCLTLQRREAARHLRAEANVLVSLLVREPSKKTLRVQVPLCGMSQIEQTRAFKLHINFEILAGMILLLRSEIIKRSYA